MADEPTDGRSREALIDGTSITDEWCEHHFDHLSQEVIDNLYPVLNRMRSTCPVAHSDVYGGYWVVTRYDEVLHIAQDWETYSSAFGLTVPVAPIAVRNLPVEIDPPLQREFKRLINPFFTPKAVRAWEPRTRTLVNRLIDGFADRGACDFMTEFARPYPAQSFFEVAINAPADEVEYVAYLANKSGAPQDPEAAACWRGLSDWIGDFLTQRRRQEPKGDVIDAILNAEIQGRPITQEEIVGTVQLLVLGGLETTAGALGQSMLRFCEHPEIPVLLREKPDLLGRAVEELLRLDSPFVQITRTAMRDVEIAGRQIRKGDKVIIYWASANRDPGEFAHSEDFDLDRATNRHLAFGAGPHRCLGSNLARMNLRIALEELLRRLDGFRLQDGAEIAFRATVNRVLLAEPISFTVR
ncbi:cytochrome P450 [Pseudofrankia saprophytica]|uniref:cytochrome P450 n=1 Tax=Pseudofrankia saprophytica TaxID=298655 RepID=UPI000234B912|nr:cytochrome P450 [Pseudofrankia saprophytica]